MLAQTTYELANIFISFPSFTRTPSLLKSHLLRQNNNNEASPQASPRPILKPGADSENAAAEEAVKNGKIEEPNAAAPTAPLPQPSPALTQVSYSLTFFPDPSPALTHCIHNLRALLFLIHQCGTCVS